MHPRVSLSRLSLVLSSLYSLFLGTGGARIGEGEFVDSHLVRGAVLVCLLTELATLTAPRLAATAPKVDLASREATVGTLNSHLRRLIGSSNHTRIKGRHWYKSFHSPKGFTQTA